jgi:hemerythrin-like domain-containing protein
MEMLNQAGTLGVSTKEGRDLVVAVKEVLLSHFRKEDAALYPALMEAAINDPGLRELLTVFFKDLEAITTSALQFLNEYSNGPRGKDFKKDLNKFSATLKRRIAKEEKLLYKEYDSLY